MLGNPFGADLLARDRTGHHGQACLLLRQERAFVMALGTSGKAISKDEGDHAVNFLLSAARRRSIRSAGRFCFNNIGGRNFVGGDIGMPKCRWPNPIGADV
jgi:hypothetical protein